VRRARWRSVGPPELAEQERVARRSVERAAGAGVGSLSLEEDLAAQAEEPGLGRPELAEEKRQSSRIFGLGVVGVGLLCLS
jgi:hypothetical protein